MKYSFLILLGFFIGGMVANLSIDTPLKEEEFIEIPEIDSTNVEPILPDTLNTFSEVYDVLLKKDVPFPDVFTAVSIHESGWDYESGLAKECHNIFGFTCQTWYKNSECSKKYNHSQFPSKYECINFLISWIRLNPPKKLESGFTYLNRRRYNTADRKYYQKLQVVQAMMFERLN